MFKYLPSTGGKISRCTICFSALVLVLVGSGNVTAQVDGTVSGPSPDEHQRVEDYWTPERIANAQPMPTPTVIITNTAGQPIYQETEQRIEVSNRQEKTLICHVGNELGPNGEEYDSTCVPEESNGYCSADAGKIDLIVVAKPAKYLDNPSHFWDGISDYEPSEVGASGDGTEDSDGNGVDDGCEPAETCPCWDKVELLSVTVANQSANFSCSDAPPYPFPLSAVIQNDGSIPDVEGGFLSVISGLDGPSAYCATRDYYNYQDITDAEADACIAQIAARCAAIGDPIVPN